MIDNLLQTHNQKNFYYILVEQAHVLDQDIAVQPKDETSSDPVTKPVVSPPVRKPVLASVESSQSTVLVLLLLLNLVRARRGKPMLTTRDLSAKSSGADLAGGWGVMAKANQSPSDTGQAKLTPINAALGQTIGKVLNGRKTGLGIAGLLAAAIVPELNPALADLLGMDVASTALPSGAEGAQTAAPDGGQANPPAEVTEQPQQTVDNAPETQTNPEPKAGSTNLWTPIASALTAWGVLGKIEKWVQALKSKS